LGLVVIANRSLRDNSFLWHIRAGTVQAKAGEVLRSDPFSFTFGGEPWRTQSWLADLLYGWLEDLSGLAFVPWLIVALGGVTLLWVGLASYRRTDHPLPVAVGLVALFWLGSAYLSPRPVLFSYALLALTALLLDVPRSRWALPLVIWLWASLHGSFILGISLIVLEGLRTGRRARFVDAGVSVAAASATAHGLAIWLMLGRFLANRDALGLITEWAPPDFTELSMAPYLLTVGLFVVAVALGRVGLRDLWVPLPFLLFGLTSARAVFPAMIVLVPWAVMAWPRVAGRARRPVPAGLAVLHWGVAAGLVMLPVALTSFPGLSEDRFPIDAVANLDEGRLFHDDVTGGYLIFAAWPRVEVYVDDRAELYGAEHLESMIRSRSAKPGWEGTLDQYGIAQALVRTADPLAEALTAAGWQEAYRDEEFVLLQK
jgi:hypothetical protein